MDPGAQNVVWQLFLLIGALVIGGIVFMLGYAALHAGYNAIWSRASPFGAALLAGALVFGGVGLIWTTSVSYDTRECGTFLRPVKYPNYPYWDALCGDARKGVLVWTLIASGLVASLAFSWRKMNLEDEQERKAERFDPNLPAELQLLTQLGSPSIRLVLATTDKDRDYLAAYRRQWKVREEWAFQDGKTAEEVLESVVKWWGGQPGAKATSLDSFEFVQEATGVDAKATADRVNFEIRRCSGP